MPALVALTGPLAGRRFELDGHAVLGREHATIALIDEETSRHHAEIRVTAGVVVVEDLASTNGTFVDGRRIDDVVELRGGETIRLGRSTFTVELDPVAVPEPKVDPSATKVSAQPDPEDDDPDRTQLRERPPRPARTEPRAQAERPEPAARPEQSEPAAQPERAEPAAQPERPEPAAQPERPVRPEPAAATTAGRASAPAAGAQPKPPLAVADDQAPAGQPFGAFAPPTPSRRRGAASRKLAPTVVSMAAILATAAALVAYFAGR